MTDPFNALEAALAERHVPCPPGAADLCRRHWALVMDENQRQNLTSIASAADAVERHYLDSLALLRVLELPEGPVRVLDAGSGAGFPGVPLKACRPRWDVTLADARLRRVRFLDRAIHALALTGCRAVHARAGRPDSGLQASYNLVTARAMAEPRVALRVLAPSVAPHGQLVLYASELGPGELDRLATEASKRGLKRPRQVPAGLPSLPDHVLLVSER
jgi:16S rRNA (guanine527-N7)-methyltransferase